MHPSNISIFLLVRFLSGNYYGMRRASSAVIPILKAYKIPYFNKKKFILFQLPQEWEWGLKIDDNAVNHLSGLLLDLRPRLTSILYAKHLTRFMEPISVNEYRILIEKMHTYLIF